MAPPRSRNAEPLNPRTQLNTLVPEHTYAAVVLCVDFVLRIVPPRCTAVHLQTCIIPLNSQQNIGIPAWGGFCDSKDGAYNTGKKGSEWQQSG